MRVEKHFCDRCGTEITNVPADGVLSAYVTVQANGSAKSDVVEYKDFCRDCWLGIITAIEAASKRIEK